MAEEIASNRLAVLIDADNTSGTIVKGLFSEIAKYGTRIITRIYGDWTQTYLNSWKHVLLEHAIQPVQQFRFTVGKNATDSAMIIDAMDLLYSKRFDAFCLVSSDSDFTRLASRIREEGLQVYGFGEQKTPRAFVSACDKFIFTEILSDPKTSAAKARRKTVKEIGDDSELTNSLTSAVESAADEEGWAYLGTVGHRIAQQFPEFDSRNYGYSKLSELMEATQLFEIDKRATEEGQSRNFVRRKRYK
jgi:uncharacterized LabA/DUF88 family protein